MRKVLADAYKKSMSAKTGELDMSGSPVPNQR